MATQTYQSFQNNKQRRVLMILSNHNQIGASGKLTGSWFTEIAAPYYTLVEAGIEVVFASPKGGDVPIDLLSMKPPYTTEFTERFSEDPIASYALRQTAKLSEVDAFTFDAVFFPGGYGLLWDLASDSVVLKLIQDFYHDDRPIAMVCHGPAILRDARKADGSYIVDGLTLTGFKNAEDAEIELDRHLLFSLEDELQARGANYVSGPNWEPNVQQDGVLMTGQSPASALPLAEALRDRFVEISKKLRATA